ncbi:MAG: paraquat-inducible protein A [Magnetococcales bacterium]|nr:paraquat-inducible protein A [Magnetococcales bacterium]
MFRGSSSPLLPNPSGLVACHECDLLHRLPTRKAGSVLSCRRCGAVLLQNRPDSIPRTAALTLGAFILFAVVNGFPLLILKIGGRETSLTLIEGALELGNHGMWEVVIVVLLTSLVFPALHFLVLLYVLLPLTLGRVPPGAITGFKMADMVAPWGMIGVYLLGVLVAVVKLADLATVVPGVAAYALGGVLVLGTAAGRALDHEMVWNRIGKSVSCHLLT